MFGPPEDVPGDCNARLYIGDDYGDNRATMRCAEPAGHEPPHCEVFGGGQQHAVVTWTEDERAVCGDCAQRVEDKNRCDACERELCDACFGRPLYSCLVCLGLYCARCEPGHACTPYESMVENGAR